MQELQEQEKNYKTGKKKHKTTVQITATKFVDAILYHYRNNFCSLLDCKK